MHDASGSDRALINRLKTGDRDALAALFHTYYDPLARFALQLTGDRATAEDIVQDLFIRLWERRGALNVSTPVQRYLYRSVKNSVIDTSRIERTRSKATIVMETVEAAEDQADDKHDALRKAVHQAIANLPEQTRLVFTLHTEHAMQHSEIAEILGISTRTAETLVSRALAKIREEVAE